MLLYVRTYTVHALVQFVIKIELNNRLLQSVHFLPGHLYSGVPRGGVGCSKPPPPEIPKVLQNRAKLNPIVKTVQNC